MLYILGIATNSLLYNNYRTNPTEDTVNDRLSAALGISASPNVFFFPFSNAALE